MDASSWNYRGDQIPRQRPVKIGSRPVYRLPPAPCKGGRAGTVARLASRHRDWSLRGNFGFGAISRTAKNFAATLALDLV
jgi:hypothetical protein